MSMTDQELIEQARVRQVVSEIEKTTPCYCDLDNWEPERSTGHSWVCPIHKLAKAQLAAKGTP